MRTLLLLITLVTLPSIAFSQESASRPIRFPRQPSLSPDGKTVAFSYQGDIWTVSSEGGTAQRLTIHEAHDQLPSYSPDGKWIAFSSKRDGNYDVYVIPSGSGKAKQLTFHSADDLAGGWSPDGKEILFTSNRETTRTTSIYAVNVATGATRLIATDDFLLANPVFTGDGTAVAATRGGAWTRRGYRGSGNGNLIRFPAKGGAGIWLTKDPENERNPCYSPDGKTLYFVSDKSGVFNIWRKNRTELPKQITKYTDGNLFYPSAARNGEKLVYEHDFALYSLNTTTGESKRLNIFAPTDDRTNSLRRETFRTGVQEAILSPDGKTVAFIVHGEVFTQPASGGEAIRITETPQREQDLAFSPDGKTLVFSSDKSGDSGIYTSDVKTKTTKTLTSTPGIAENNPVFSPDGKTIAFLRGFNGAELCVIPATGGEPRVLMHDPSVQYFAWSPDSKWIAYSRMKSHSAGTLADIFVVKVEDAKTFNVSQYPVVNGQPIWSNDGTKLFFLSNRSGNVNIWSVSLEEEKDKDDAEETEKKPDPKAEKKPVVVKIDFNEIQKRAKQITRTEGDVSNFALSPDGKTLVFSMAQLGKTDLWRIPAAGGDTPTRLTQSGEAGSSMQFAPDGSRVIYLSGGGIRSFALSGTAAAPIPISARMDVDIRQELAQMFDEAWRKMRDGFYDEKMHGADWNAVRARYRPVVEDITYKEDFYVLFTLVLGELNASHTGITPAPGGASDGLTTASLGVEFDDTYTGKGVRVKSVMPKSPADKDESRLNVGDIILKVDGRPVTGNETFYSLLGDKAGKRVELTVNKEPKEEGARTVKLRALTGAAYKQLEYDRWQKEREAVTEKLSGGRLGYLHLNAMGPEQLEKFKREVFGNLQTKDGLVLDVRFNGGGSIADEMFAIFQNKVFAYRTLRSDPVRSTAPISAWNKPIIVLANEASFSNAEVFPWGVKDLKLGKVVGMPTFGGVIGTGATNLIDGSGLRMPAVGTYTLSGINQENHGCPPDIAVENTPEDVFGKKDRQLERAVEELVKELPRRAAEK